MSQSESSVRSFTRNGNHTEIASNDNGSENVTDFSKQGDDDGTTISPFLQGMDLSR